ncbi:hypothetical protein MVEN_02240400 [Mycena venus]|uniref:Uncharacterized protein n=1 Tax=Mycena venus TaxID=2733690 RepID=A0A8H6X5K9_9AGAR|nr:hypothetical protein MVEN_02240400 [Mycena venus]
MAGKRIRLPSRRAREAAPDASSDSDEGTSRARRKRRAITPGHSVASQSSSPGPAGSHTTLTIPATLTKREKFDIRYKTSTRSNAEVLAAQKATWTSDVYSHFRDPEIVQEGGEVKYKFTCKK